MILFAGDSFSHFADEESWTYKFSQELNMSHKNLSSGGTSFWFTYKKILENNNDIINKKYNYIIITCTSPQRIPYCKDVHLSYYVGEPSPITNNNEKFLQDIQHFGYYERFYDRVLHEYLYKKNLSDLTYQLPTTAKLILLPCFQESLYIIKQVFHENRNFLYLDFPLTKIMDSENGKNHFSYNMNMKFGLLLAEKSKNYTTGSIDLTVKEIKDAMK